MNRFNLILGQAIPRAAAPKVSGTMEVIAPEDGYLIGTCLALSSSSGRTDTMKEPKNRPNGRLHVFGSKEALVIEPIQTIPCKGCGNESSSRSYTPSKQILLSAPKSPLVKQSALTKTVKDKNSTTSVRVPDSIEEEAEIRSDEQLKTVLPKLNHETEITEAKTESEVIDEKEKISQNLEKASSSKVFLTETKQERIDKQNAADEKPSDSSDDDSGQENDVQKQTAPLELMGEFLTAIMEQKYELAKKLCQMILIYEPENPEAKQFIPLIEHKLLLESTQLAEEDEDETGEESSDDSEEDTSSTDNSETDSDSSSKDSDDND